MAYIVELPTKLVLILFPLLPTSTLNALAQTCHRLRKIFQRDLESRLTRTLGRSLPPWTVESRPHIIRRLVFPPHSIHPDNGYWRWTERSIHIAVQAGKHRDCIPAPRGGCGSFRGTRHGRPCEASSPLGVKHTISQKLRGGGQRERR
ncbi:hypothetical protein B0H19DRAFT_1191674 [Mycena capillaripes]|nr:hypothetical protein B0H19DRAFT_1191674 [Mycena capillaripes]